MPTLTYGQGIPLAIALQENMTYSRIYYTKNLHLSQFQ